MQPKSSYLLTILLLTVVAYSYAQNPWNNKKCAVVLTYDDALNVHLDNAIPQLDSLGLKGTFYLSAFMPGCKNRLEDWKLAAKHGHELGNHTLFHPCIGNTPDRSWVTAERDLSKYTLDRFVDEIRMTNVFLQALDGKTQRTFAYPCGDTLAQNQSVISKITSDFASARGVKGEMLSIKYKNFYNAGSYMINGNTSPQLIAMVKEAMKTNSAIVFMFHGVGGEHGLNVGLKEHRELLKFLKANEKEIWTTTFIELTEHMKKSQKLSASK
jgi:peptidoglycan/xylan/chitin deacetylase (PgdA/CDA1 family)